jgi:predicted dehydrogenase
MKSIINFAVLGCGLIADFHLYSIGKIKNANLVGVCDHNISVAQKKAAEYHTTYYSTYEDLLTDSSVDAVCICTPSGFHFEQALAALSHGKHVLVEKPVAFSLKDCDQLEKKAHKQRVKISVVSQLRSSSSIQLVKRSIEEGILGRIVSANLSMNYYRNEEYYSQSTWRGTYKMDGGGALMNQGIHGIDLLRYLMGPIDSITALSGTFVHNIEVEDTLCALVTFKNGAFGNIQAATSAYPGSPRELQINGSLGSILLRENIIARFDVKDRPDCKALESDTLQYLAASNPVDIDNEGHLIQIQNFTNTILNDAELLVTIQDGRNALEIILGAYESAKQKMTIHFK